MLLVLLLRNQFLFRHKLLCFPIWYGKLIYVSNSVLNYVGQLIDVTKVIFLKLLLYIIESGLDMKLI